MANDNGVGTARGLRKQAIAAAQERGHKRTWIQSAPAATLANYLETGILPSDAETIGTDGDNVLDILAKALANRASVQVDEDSVRAIVADAIAEVHTGNLDAIVEMVDKMIAAAIDKMTPAISQIEVKRADGTIKNVGAQHAYFPLLLKVCGAGLFPMLVGPAGSGKSHAAHAVADAMGLPYYAISVCEMSSQTDLLGYRDAHGVYVETLFRKAYEHGGVFLLDEIDAGNPAVLLVLNQALANGACAFADGMIKRHPDFILIAAANTYGTGADRQYVGRNQLDAATLDRYFFIDWPYDEALEGALIGSMAKIKAVPCKVEAGGILDAATWHAEIMGYRTKIASLKLRHVVSPRASIGGMKCFAAGIGAEWVRLGLVYKGAGTDMAARLKG